MLFQSLISLSLLLFTSATPTPLFDKRDESIVKIMTTSYTRISHVNDLKNVALNGLESVFDFTRNSPPGSQESETSDKQEFNWDVFENGSNFGKQLYHLKCCVEVSKDFRGTAKYNLNLGPPHVTLISGTLDAQTDIEIICPKADAQCSLPEGDKGCDDIPGWDGKGE
ncbi:uncharacterized protein L199_001120 [Kwoniella botswanensis]|uniref:uncharacterized protein n=1 Tax=Kwoniella botswanensis TaxID=1268659 RepID=UPI00315C4F5D